VPRSLGLAYSKMIAQPVAGVIRNDLRHAFESPGSGDLRETNPGPLPPRSTRQRSAE